MRSSIIGIVALSLLSCSSSATRPPAADAAAGPRTDAAAETAPAAQESHGWPVLGDLRPFCGGSATAGDGSEIVWNLFTSPRPPREVAADYSQRLGGDMLEESGNEWIWRHPSPRRPDRVLSISGGDRPTEDCPNPPAGTNAIVSFSEVRRPAP